MWTCLACNEVNADRFENCWKCGDSRLNPTAPISEEGKARVKAEYRALAKTVNCSRCGAEESVVRKIRAMGDADVSKQVKFVCVCCTKCGHVQMFDADVLDEIEDSEE